VHKIALGTDRAENPVSNSTSIVARRSLLWERVYGAVAWKRLWHIRLSRSRSIVTAPHATLLFGTSALLLCVNLMCFSVTEPDVVIIYASLQNLDGL
jgi:hypothetical protein